MEEYCNVNLSVFDFLNFIIPQQTHIESIHGVLQNIEKDSKENTMPNQKQDDVKIFHTSVIKKMFKDPSYMHQLFPYDESQRGSIPELFQKYMQKWFEISADFRPLLDRYFGVMHNPEEYVEFKFLSLAQGLEAYHKILKDQTSSSRRLDYRERVTEVYEQYSEIADILFKFRDVGCFTRKVTKTRHFLSHGSQGKANGVVFDDDLFWLTLDLQLLLQFCIMEKIGFTKEDIIQIYGTDVLWKVAYGR